MKKREIKPIIFNSAMINAILAHIKVQTRRPVKGLDIDRVIARDEFVDSSPYPLNRDADPYYCYVIRADGEPLGIPCPVGMYGDHLWVRETMHITPYLDLYYSADITPVDNTDIEWFYRAPEYVGGVPSIHMPRWASRITLEITCPVKIKRLHDMTTNDAVKEGYPVNLDLSPLEWFENLWNSIYNNWDENPWVWVIDLKRIK